ncbi:hypothetical protein Golomagni_00320 [Golovinomyces magnicellulatus]|nr:hypothetical protein Golomagni_00320 [Golovinomyces magnicellulatus]
MVCSKCQKLQKSTILATPEVKRKSEIYYGSSMAYKSKQSPTLGNNGIGKSKLLSKAAKNPYTSSSCKTCKTKVEQGRTYCQKCAYKANGIIYMKIVVDDLLACLICGKTNSKSIDGVPRIEGQKFTLK